MKAWEKEAEDDSNSEQEEEQEREREYIPHISEGGRQELPEWALSRGTSTGVVACLQGYAW